MASKKNKKKQDKTPQSEIKHTQQQQQQQADKQNQLTQITYEQESKQQHSIQISPKQGQSQFLQQNGQKKMEQGQIQNQKHKYMQKSNKQICSNLQDGSLTEEYSALNTEHQIIKLNSINKELIKSIQINQPKLQGENNGKYNNQSISVPEQENIHKSNSRTIHQQHEILDKQAQPQGNGQSQGKQNNLKKQDSIDSYLQLKYSGNINQMKNQIVSDRFQKLQKKFSKIASMKGLVSIDDSEDIPSLQLQASPREQMSLLLQIISYRTMMFFTMSTQIFTIKITNKNKNKNDLQDFVIERRFSDFADLYDQLFYNQPGYILFPFPEKSLDSFMKIKLGLTVESPTQQTQIIEKRIKQLEEFINWVSGHQQLSNSQQFQNFICIDSKKYEQSRGRLNKYVQEHKSLISGSHLKNIIQTGKNLVTSYFSNKDERRKSSQHTTEYQNSSIVASQEYVQKQKIKLQRLIYQCQLLLKAQKQLSQFNLMNTENDFLLKICAKHSSGQQYCENWADFIQNNFLQVLNLNFKIIEQCQKRLIHRAQIIQAIIQSKNQTNADRKAKLQRILQRANKNFQQYWVITKHQIQQQLKINQLVFNQQWLKYKLNMKKIWKSIS